MMDVLETRVSQTRRMIYTADDERIGTLVSDTDQRWTVRDFGGKVVREFYGFGGDDWVWRQDYVYGGGQLIAGRRENRFGGIRHFHLDHLGSVRLITDAAREMQGRHDLRPFGVEQTDPTYEVNNFYGRDRAEPMKFTGHERDWVGYTNVESDEYLDYMHARFYSASSGRFLSVDPAMDIEKNQSEPQRWKRYVYATNNPLKYVDPDGRAPTSANFTIGRYSFHLDWTHSSLRNPAPHFDVKVGQTKLGRFHLDKWAAEKGADIPKSAVQLLEEAAEEGKLPGTAMRALRQYAPKRSR